MKQITSSLLILLNMRLLQSIIKKTLRFGLTWPYVKSQPCYSRINQTVSSNYIVKRGVIPSLSAQLHNTSVEKQSIYRSISSFPDWRELNQLPREVTNFGYYFVMCHILSKNVPLLAAERGYRNLDTFVQSTLHNRHNISRSKELHICMQGIASLALLDVP